jgi:hypothetical protein
MAIDVRRHRGLGTVTTLSRDLAAPPLPSTIRNAFG